MARALLLALALLVLLPTLAAADGPAEYRAALAETLRAAEEASRITPPLPSLALHPPLERALARLETAREVTVAPGQSVAVDNARLVRQLRADRGEGQQAIAGLQHLLAALDRAAARQTETANRNARTDLERVLAQPRFHPTPNPITQFLADLRTRLFRWLASLMPGFQIPGWAENRLGTVLSWLFILLLIGLAVFALVFFVFSLRGARRSVVGHAALGKEQIARPEDAAGARRAAQQAADRGDYRQAIHYLYLSAMLHLVARSRLRYDRALTNHEQLRTVQGDGELAELLQPLVSAFDRLWYGHRPCGVKEYSEFRGAVERVVEATR